ncbi:Vacuolar protein sorting-associated protein atg6 [Malassezia sp. CBS 17886]|nr:Vacuolar protein sorting-associated protein atg6 [Malassezia sp. CBS 17886]
MAFTCQRCAQPLLLSDSLANEDGTAQRAVERTVREIFPPSTKSPAPSGARQQLASLPIPETAQYAVLAHMRTADASGDTSAHDQHMPAAQPAHCAALFSALSTPARPGLDTAPTPIDHPLCDACTQVLLECMASDIANARQERDTLRLLETELARAALADGDEEKATEDKARWQREQNGILREIEEIRAERERMEGEVQQLDAEETALDGELQALQDEETALAGEEETFWREYNAQATELSELQSEEARLSAQLEHDRAVLAQLEGCNAYRDVFHITQDGYGTPTINGLRLGRLGGFSGSARNGEQVEWPEINAAWGQAALLVTVLARKMHVSFSTVVERLGPEKAVYELYGTNEWQIGRLLHSRRFDYAMVGFLTCVHELAAHAQARDETLYLPHTIAKDRIGDASIRLQFNQAEVWTRAIRYLFATLRALLEWTIEPPLRGEV